MNAPRGSLRACPVPAACCSRLEPRATCRRSPGDSTRERERGARGARAAAGAAAPRAGPRRCTARTSCRATAEPPRRGAGELAGGRARDSRSPRSGSWCSPRTACPSHSDPPAPWRCSTQAGAGWRRGVLERGVEALRRRGRGAGAIVAILGPCAGACCYEVGPEVHRRRSDCTAGAARNLDLRAIARERLLGAGVSEIVDVRALHDLRRALLLPSSRRNASRAPGGDRMAQLIGGLDAERSFERTSRASSRRSRCRRAGHCDARGRARSPRQPVEVLAATKYVALEDMRVLAQAGVRLVGENRAQELQAKVAAYGELFEWDFIGQLQSRQGAHDRAARAPDPLARLATRRCSARAGRRVSSHARVCGCWSR